MKEIRQWNKAWNRFDELDPVSTDFLATGLRIYSSSLLSLKLVELISIAFDASITHLDAPGTRRGSNAW